MRHYSKLLSPQAHSKAWGYLTNCYVHAAFRNAGLGARLLGAIKIWACEQGLEMLVVWPSDAAYDFYERAGFARYRDPLVLKLVED